MKNNNIEQRLIDFACLCIQLTERLPSGKASQVLAHQLVRSATASALNYGEAQAAESKADFIHKLKICLKELRESRVSLKIIHTKPIMINQLTDRANAECEELVSIITKSIVTCQRNMQATRKHSP
jgi:four helix bundle protein